MNIIRTGKTRGSVMRKTTFFLILLLILTACSVTTPRDESLTVRGSVSENSDGDGTENLDGGAESSFDVAADDETGTVQRDVDASGGVQRDPDAPDGGSGGSSGDSDGGRTGTPETAQQSPSDGTGASSGRTSRPVVGVTDDSIVVSVAWPFSGAVGQLYENFYSTAAVTWAEDINERGGIHGRKIVLKKVDNRGTVDGQVAACREIQSNGSFVAMTEGSIGDTASDCLDEAGFPAIQSTSDSRAPSWRYVRAVASAESAKTLGQYILGPVGGAGKKIGIIYSENYESYKDATIEGVTGSGLEVVRSEPIARNQASFTSELLRLRQEGAEVVVIFANFEAVGILRDARAINYQPTWTGMLWVADELSRAGGDLMDGIKALRYWTTTDTDAWRQYRTLVAKHGNGTPSSSSTAYYGTLVVLGRALELAGEDLDRESLHAGFNDMDGFDPGFVPPVTYSRGRVVGTNAQFPVRCCNQTREWVGIGPASTRF